MRKIKHVFGVQTFKNGGWYRYQVALALQVLIYSLYVIYRKLMRLMYLKKLLVAVVIKIGELPRKLQT